MEKLLKLRDEMKEDLLHGSIFPFWESNIPSITKTAAFTAP